MFPCWRRMRPVQMPLVRPWHRSVRDGHSPFTYRAYSDRPLVACSCCSMRVKQSSKDRRTYIWWMSQFRRSSLVAAVTAAIAAALQAAHPPLSRCSRAKEAGIACSCALRPRGARQQWFVVCQGPGTESSDFHASGQPPPRGSEGKAPSRNVAFTTPLNPLATLQLAPVSTLLHAV